MSTVKQIVEKRPTLVAEVRKRGQNIVLLTRGGAPGDIVEAVDSGEPGSELGLLGRRNGSETGDVVVVALVKSASQSTRGKIGAKALVATLSGNGPHNGAMAGRTGL